MPAPRDLHCPRDGQTILSRYRRFVIGAIIYLILVQCAVLYSGMPKAIAGYGDFRSFYTAGFMVRSGAAHQLYDLKLQEETQNRIVSHLGVLPFLYPAFSALLFVPLSLLGWRAAYFVFFFTNLLLLWIAARLMRDSLPHLSELWPPLPLALFCCFFPVGEALMQGQSSFLLLALYCAAFAALEKGRPLRAGLFLGLAVLKFQTALPVALLLLLWRRWRAFAGFLLTAAATLAASLAITGYPAFVQYWRTILLAATGSSATTPTLTMLPELMPNLFGLAEVLSRGAAWGAAVSAALSLVLFLWMASRPRSFPAAVVAALLLSRYLGLHDLVLLLPAVALALERGAIQPTDGRTRAAALAALLLLLPPVYLLLLGHHRVCWLAAAILVLLIGVTRMPAEAPALSS